MNVEKVIRVLGYSIYLVMWSPVVLLCITVLPVVGALMCVRDGRSPKETIVKFKDGLVNGVRHDKEFIRTGKW